MTRWTMSNPIVTDSKQTLSVLFDAMSRDGARPAVIAFGRERRREISRDALARRAFGLAAGTRSGGIEADETVVLFGSTGPEWITVCLGLLAAGAVPVPIDDQLAGDDLERILDDCGAKVAFVDEARSERLDAAGFEGRRVRLDTGESDPDSWLRLVAQAETTNTPRPPEPGARAVLLYTSGTTGEPKGVPLLHRNLAFQLHTLIDTGLVRDDDRLLLPLPAHHVYPLVVGVLAPLAIGCTVVLPHRISGPQLVRAIGEGGVTIVIGVPKLYRGLLSAIETRLSGNGRVRGAFVRALLATLTHLRRRFGVRAGRTLLAPLHRRLGPGLRVLASGGAKLDPDVALRLEGIGWRVAIGYGLTETSPLLTMKRPEEGGLDTVGRPVEGVELRIRPSEGTDDAAPSSPDREGEILARGPGVFEGYHHRDRETRESFTDDGWFRTGDLGHIDDEGRLSVSGRATTLLVTSAGENVPPVPVERHYAEHPAIEEVGVLLHDDDLVAVIVPSGEAGRDEDERERAVRRATKQRASDLPSHHRISSFRMSSEPLPRTRLGKIRRNRLEQRYDALGERDGSAPERREDARPGRSERMSPEDRELLSNDPARTVWDLLERRHSDRPLTPDSDVRGDLGIDSLDWVELSMEIAERTGIELDEDAIGSVESVRDLLRTVAESDPSADGDVSDPLENPGRTLDDDERRWIEPLPAIAERCARGLASVNRRLASLLLDLRVEGAERLPDDGPVVIAPNHASYLDPFAVAAALPASVLRRAYWGGWTGAAFRNRAFRAISRLARAIPVDPDRSAISSLALAAAVLERGDVLIWFPEGERSSDGELREFRKGIGLLVSRGLADRVVPVCIDGTHEAWPPHERWPRPGTVRVRFGEPCTADDLERRERGDKRSAEERIASALHDRVAALCAPDPESDPESS